MLINQTKKEFNSTTEINLDDSDFVKNMISESETFHLMPRISNLNWHVLWMEVNVEFYLTASNAIVFTLIVL